MLTDALEVVELSMSCLARNKRKNGLDNANSKGTGVLGLSDARILTYLRDSPLGPRKLM